MRLALTGVPGTGKTTIARSLVHSGLGVVDLNEFARATGFLREKDAERDAFLVDTKKLARVLDGALDAIDGDVVVEGHFAHEMKVDAIALLRCDPLVLVDRLRKRGWREAKVRENVEAEALDVVAHEVLEKGILATELDVTHLSVEEAARALSRIVEKGPKAFKGKTVGSAAWRVETLPWF